MEFRDATRKIIALVEQKTGFPVRSSQDSTLSTLAAVRMARTGMPVHVITWNPSAKTPPDYLIASECGFILRLFELPPERRKSLNITQSGRDEVEHLVRTSGIAQKLQLPDKMLAAMRDQLFEGLMRQLRSIPIGLRVDSWIRSQFPELAELQEASIRTQLQDNAKVLEPQVRQLAPERILKANTAMNAAFAAFWAKTLEEPRFALPYKATRYWAIAAKLLEIVERVPDAASEDVRLVDEWATELQLNGWYEWLPYELDRGPGGTK